MGSQPIRQRTDTVVMVRPAGAGPNPQTAASNAFQGAPAATPDAADEAAAQAEFDGLVQALEGAGVRVIVFEGDPARAAPDQHFPNNWLSLHADGTAMLYPMEAPNRRRERRHDILDALVTDHGFALQRTLDLSAHEDAGRYLEGTGSLIFDHPARRVYACRSSRTHPAVAVEASAALDHELILFDAVDARGRPIYHTNVMLTIGTGFALVCLDAVPDPAQRERLQASLAAPGREIMPISVSQMAAFAGNALELEGHGAAVLALSRTASDVLTPPQREALARHVRLVDVAVPTIERLGGGSVRCMLAEVFLPRRSR